jgi:hypothetical protein
MSVRDELLAAIEAGDHQAVHRRGWGDVWEHLATANLPKQGCTLNELKPYAKLLGNDPAEAILEALDACAGEFRPTAGDVRGYLNRRRGDNDRVDVGRGRDRSSTPEALIAVADAVRAGEQACTCGPPTLRRWRPDAAYVLRCPEGHLEQGQVFAAEDAGLIRVAA